MGVGTKVLITMTMAICLISSAAYASKGTATFYTSPYVPSACNGYKNGVMIAAASYAIWNNGAVCNKRFRVKCTGATNQGTPHPGRGGSVLVKIVDLCPAGCRGTIDLSQEAFSKIAEPEAGKIKIEFNPYAHMAKTLYYMHEIQ